MGTLSLINRFKKDVVTVKRKAAGSYIEGVFTDGEETEIEITGSIQPLNGKELLVLSEGNRVKDTIKIYTDSELRTDKSSTCVADLIEYNNKIWQVMNVFDYSTTIAGTTLTHYKALCVNVVEETMIPPYPPPDPEPEP